LWTSGGSLNPNKFLNCYIKPQYDYTKQRIENGTSSQTRGEILLKIPTNWSSTPLSKLEPTCARRTLEILFAPDGNCNLQIKHCTEKASAFLNKVNAACYPWPTVTSLIEPTVRYSLMACKCTTQDIRKVDKIVTTAKCHTLGLNEHFPRAVLNGPMHLAGIIIPIGQSKINCGQIKLLSYHIRTEYTFGTKLDQ
jgi:hypothetical protein